jgi:hypothetical protein
MKPASRTPVLDIFRLYPDDVSLTHMLICHDASLLAAAAPAPPPRRPTKPGSGSTPPWRRTVLAPSTTLAAI